MANGPYEIASLFAPVDPYRREREEAARRIQYAQALAAQADQPTRTFEGPMGPAYTPLWGEILRRAIPTVGGAYLESKAREKEADISEREKADREEFQDAVTRRISREPFSIRTLAAHGITQQDMDTYEGSAYPVAPSPDNMSISESLVYELPSLSEDAQAMAAPFIQNMQLQEMMSEQDRQRAREDFAAQEAIRAQFAPPTAPPANVQEYLFAVNQGYQGSYEKWATEDANRRRPLTTIDMSSGESGPQFGNIPPGYMMVQNPEGAYQMVPVPGSPAEREIESEETDAGLRAGQRQQTADIVIEDIDRAMDLTATSNLPVTGFFGSAASVIPGTTAHDVSQLLNAIYANISFDKLQQMRDLSPTGAALGPVSDFENRRLQAVYGSLEQSQSKEQFLFNLERLKQVYSEIIHGPNGGESPPGITPEDWQYMSPEERALWQ